LFLLLPLFYGHFDRTMTARKKGLFPRAANARAMETAPLFP